jgi:hypothetical protein
MGGVEVKDEKWDAGQKQLHLKVSLVSNYPSIFTVYTAGRVLKTARATGAEVYASSEEQVLRVKLASSRSGEAEVTLQFE